MHASTHTNTHTSQPIFLVGAWKWGWMEMKSTKVNLILRTVLLAFFSERSTRRFTLLTSFRLQNCLNNSRQVACIPMSSSTTLFLNCCHSIKVLKDWHEDYWYKNSHLIHKNMPFLQHRAMLIQKSDYNLILLNSEWNVSILHVFKPIFSKSSLPILQASISLLSTTSTHQALKALMFAQLKATAPTWQ